MPFLKWTKHAIISDISRCEFQGYSILRNDGNRDHFCGRKYEVMDRDNEAIARFDTDQEVIEFVMNNILMEE